MKIHGTEVRGSSAAPLSAQYEGRFGRMFRRLKPAPAYEDVQLEQLANSMREQLASGGWNPTVPIQDGDNDTIPAGYTYFGQFLDHDLTFDPASSLQRQNDPDALHDFRSPRFDLDSLYGSGPDDEPFLYDQDPVTVSNRLLVDVNVNGVADLPRNSKGIALIGDPRNDENTIVSQIQFAFLKLHNKLLAEVPASDTGGSVEDRRRQQFEACQQLVRWHYQWLIAFDFLPKLVGVEVMGKVWRDWQEQRQDPDIRRRFFKPRNNPYMPVEFSAAAFRFGHSQIRPAYDLNDQVRQVPIFVPGDGPGVTGDLRGFRPLPAGHTIDWRLFFPLAESVAQPSRLINTQLSGALFDLPHIDDPDARRHSLAFRNLLRGQRLGLPSGQDVARAMGNHVLTGADVGSPLDPTPLWFYVLGEAQTLHGGKHLGPTGGRIVAEVLLGLLELDPQSFLRIAPTWMPPEERRTVGELLAYATAAP